MSLTLDEGKLLKNGEYRILRVLGQGGFGITYEAEQVHLGRRVAVKEFFMKDCCERSTDTSLVTVPTSSNRSLVDKFKDKFIKEARMIASLDHPNIVRVLDVFEDNGTAYYVMDNLPGGSLSGMVKAAGALPEAKALFYIRQIADALAYIHSKNLVHLDVKPSNILLSAKGDAVLIDFGISKHYDSSGEQTSSTPVGYSQGYAPLEQMRAGDVKQFTPATDIYALGATLYYLLTGMVPPNCTIVLEDGIERPAGLSEPMWRTIEAAMHPRRKDRIQSIDQFLALMKSSAPAPAPQPVRVAPPVADERTVVAGSAAAAPRISSSAPSPVGQNVVPPASENELLNRIYRSESKEALRQLEQFCKSQQAKSYYAAKYKALTIREDNKKATGIAKGYVIFCVVIFVVTILIVLLAIAFA